MLLLSNPVAGSGGGPAFIAQHVLPLLNRKGRTYQHVVTQSAGDAGIQAVEYIQNLSQSEPIIIVSGGDGTVHEVINGLAQVDVVSNGGLAVEIAILPFGTANAMYSTLFPPSSHQDLDLTGSEYKLLSLQLYLDTNRAERKRFSLAIQSTTLLSPSGDSVSNILSVVVTSTSLHASILHTADRLKHDRPDVVGVERFKVAAMENIANWYHSSVELIPLGLEASNSGESQGCLKYNSATKRFEPCLDLKLEGPFEYFLSTVNVDRLEPDFVIVPLLSKLPSTNNQSSMDLVIVRPFRHPLLKEGKDDEANRKKFVDTSIAVLQHAYKDGAHVDLRYGKDGTAQEDGDGEPLVEYFRCSGWEWIPVRVLPCIIPQGTDVSRQKEEDRLAQLLCADGTIVSIPAGGKAVCRLLTGEDRGPKLSIWV
jgi:hypothetical protein